jgi:hypothetical protein
MQIIVSCSLGEVQFIVYSLWETTACARSISLAELCFLRRCRTPGCSPCGETQSHPSGRAKHSQCLELQSYVRYGSGPDITAPKAFVRLVPLAEHSMRLRRKGIETGAAPASIQDGIQDDPASARSPLGTIRLVDC